MKCQHCGTDSNFEWATFCRNCNQPLKMDNSGSAAQGSVSRDQTLESTPAPYEQPVNLDDADQIEIGVADPMDFIIGKTKKDPQETQAMEIPEQISPEPIEHELTLYKDDAVKLSISEGVDNPKVTIESIKEGFKVAADNEEKIEVTDHFNDYRGDQEEEVTNQPSEIALPSPPPAPEPRAEVAEPEPALESQRTQKFMTPTPEPELPEIETERPEPPQNLSDVTYSKGVIYLAGKNLKLTGGMKVDPGDEITINNKVFQVKREKKKNNNIIFWIAGGAVGVFLILLILSGFLSKDIGQLAGMVVDGATGKALAGVTVRLSEVGKSAKTNEAGFFVFDQVPSGIHTIEYRSADGVARQDRVTVIKNQTSTISLATAVKEMPHESEAPVEKPEPPPADRERSTSVSDKGFLKLSLTPNNSSIYLDGNPIGVGSNTYKVSPGTYELSIRKDGYEDYRQTVKIEQNKTQSVKIMLSMEAKGAQSGRKSLTEQALEKESSGNYKEAARLYDQALKDSPRDVAAILGKARCAREEGAFDKAIANFQHAAKIAQDKGDTKAEIEALTGVIELRPNTYTAYASRGDILYGAGQYKKAADDFAKVVELDKRNLGAYYKLGNSFYALGQYNDALSVFLAAEEINFADPKAQVYLAKTYLALGDKRNTKKSYEKFKELASYSAKLEFKKDAEWQKVLTALGEKE